MQTASDLNQESRTGQWRGVVGVAAWCPAGHAAVLTCYPLRRAGGTFSPFPTLFWLACPRLCREVSHLERDGAIAEIQAELGRDKSLAARLLQNHEDYVAHRWKTLSPEDQALITGRGSAAAFQRPGIGGMRNRAAVKCLHLHVAHHLAAGNVIGELVLRRFGLRPCGAA